MQLVSTFEVPADIADVWELLGDIPTIAPCLPGATVRPVSGDTYEGEVTVKVGPIKAGYSGQATVTKRDEANHVMVVEGKGAEGNGKGSATGLITLTLSQAPAAATAAEVVIDLTITGRLAQFGRSAMSDVSQRLVDQFAANLADLVMSQGKATSPTAEVGSGAVSHGAGAESTTKPTAATTDNTLDAMSLVLPMLKQAAPVIGAGLMGLTLGVLLGRLAGGGPRRAEIPQIMFETVEAGMGGSRQLAPRYPRFR